MERIKAAIEKAKAQAVEAAPPALAPPPQVDELDVSYTATEVITLDAAHLERHRVVTFNKQHPSNQAFDILRTQVLQKMDEKGWRTLAITSPTKEAGKTSVAINLAASIAHHTQRTAMLVDFDLRHPCVAKYLGIRRSPSLNEVLNGEADLQAALVNPGLPHLVVLPTNEPVARSAEVLSSTSVAQLVEDLRNRYSDRIVIFDLPPALAADDVMAIMPRMDCMLLVVGSGTSTQREIEETLRQMPATPSLGYVVNKDDAPLRRGYEYC